MDGETRAKVIQAYQTSRNSIQDIARIFKVDVHEVMAAIGEGHSSFVHVPGDLIDQGEAGPNADMNYGKDVKIQISVD